MKTVTVILCVVLLVAFKLIEKKLQKSSGTGGRRTPGRNVSESIPEVFPVSPEEDSVADMAQAPVHSSEPQENPVPDTLDFTEETFRDREEAWEARRETARKRKPVIAAETEKKAPGHGIDPKKLVIYSEIMKPKY